jgi:small GTP-binding protein
MSKICDITFKILMIGDSNVGKSSILLKYTHDNFNNEHLTTIGLDFHVKYLKLNDKNIKLQLWDTAGQERFRSIITSYFRDAQGILVVYDVTNKISFENVENWIKDINDNCKNNNNIFLVANKIDLNRIISEEEGNKLAQKYNLLYYECSAKTGENIQNIYYNISTILSKKYIENIVKLENIDFNNPPIASKCNC